MKGENFLYFLHKKLNNLKSSNVQKDSQTIIINDNPDIIKKNNFEFQYVIGKGGFGKVWKVIYKKTGKCYAMKEMSKAKIIDKKSVENIIGEKEILSILHHPFIVNMIYTFQDREYLYLLMELLNGGNLRYHLNKKRKFQEDETRCIITGLKYIHENNILHRDIKPENLVFDSKGYLRITDFGIAKKYTLNNKKDTSGTVGYLAPEILCNQNHGFSIDYYSIGIITYECIFGHRPYIGKNKNEIKQMIITKQAKITYEDLPENYSYDIIDFVNRLIQRKPSHRLGKNSINELIEHPWFNNFDWDNLLKKRFDVPFVIHDIDNYDKKYCLANEKIGEETLNRYKIILNDFSIEEKFKSFNSNVIPDELKVIQFKKIDTNTLNNNTLSKSRNKTNNNINNNKKKTKSNFKNISYQDNEINKISNVLFDSKSCKKLKRTVSNLNGNNNIVNGQNILNIEKNLFNSRFARNKLMNQNFFNLTNNEKLYPNKSKSNYKSKNMSIINLNIDKKLPYIHLSIPKKRNETSFFYKKLNQHMNGDIKKRINQIYNNSIIHKSLNSSRNFVFNFIDKKSH